MHLPSGSEWEMALSFFIGLVLGLRALDGHQTFIICHDGIWQAKGRHMASDVFCAALAAKQATAPDVTNACMHAVLHNVT